MPTIFITTVNQMLVFFLLIASGYLLNKLKLIEQNSGAVLAKLESYLILPALVFNVFSSKCTLPILEEKVSFLLWGAAVVTIAFGLALLLSKLFAKDRTLRNIYTYSFAVANFGFMGYAVVGSVFGEDMLFNMMIFCLPLNLFVYSIGMKLLIPGQAKISWKTLVNPIFLSMVLGAVAGITALPLPSFFTTAISTVSACMAPLAMILTGFIIGNYRLKTLISNPKVYIASALRLIVIPLAFVLMIKAMGNNSNLTIIILSALAMPLGLNTVVFPAAYGGDTTTGASMALVSHVLAVITIPLMFALLLH